MTYDQILKDESNLLEKIIDEKFQEFSEKLNKVKLEDFDSTDKFVEFCHELTQSYLYEFRYYVNSKFFSEDNVVLINGLGYTHPINSINFSLQVLISQKHKQFGTLYHQYLSDNLSES